jgi:hypothetical protein
MDTGSPQGMLNSKKFQTERLYSDFRVLCSTILPHTGNIWEQGAAAVFIPARSVDFAVN